MFTVLLCKIYIALHTQAGQTAKEKMRITQVRDDGKVNTMRTLKIEQLVEQMKKETKAQLVSNMREVLPYILPGDKNDYIESVAIQLIDGFIIQPRRFLQSLLTVTVGTFYDALVVVQISQEFTGSAQGIRPLGVQHGNVGQNHPVLLPDVLQGFGKVVILLHGGAIRITDQFPNVW